MTRFESTGSIWDARSKTSGRKATVVTDDNKERVLTLFEDQPSTSTRQASQQLGISKTSLQRLTKAVGLHPYKIQMCQPLKEGDAVRRRDFANHMIAELENGSISEHKIWFSDEAHFQLNGYVNKQNWRHWGTENPHLSAISPLHPQRVTVWCAISSKRIVGPVFIDGMVTGVKYRELLERHFGPEAGRLNMTRRYWFMQDGARPHRTADVFMWLETTFGERLIALDAEKFTGHGIEWPPYSPDLNPCDFFLWGFIKDRIYKNPLNSLENLKSAIRSEIGALDSDTLQRVMTDFRNRLYTTVAADGRHFEHLVH